MRRLILSLTIVLCYSAATAQAAEDSVKATVNSMFAAMKNGDASSFKTLFSETALLQTIARKDGKMSVVNESIGEFAEQVGKLKKDSADEQIRFETIKIDGPLAMAWTPYNFYYNGKFSHCGVNSFQLVRIDGIWKIQYIIDTRRRTDCQP